MTDKERTITSTDLAASGSMQKGTPPLLLHHTEKNARPMRVSNTATVRTSQNAVAQCASADESGTSQAQGTCL